MIPTETYYTKSYVNIIKAVQNESSKMNINAYYENSTVCVQNNHPDQIINIDSIAFKFNKEHMLAL